VNLKQVTLIVGGNNEVEMREKRDKIIDSYNAVIKAKEFGILPGCGVALLRASCLLDLLEFEDDRVREVLRAALRLPFELLAAGCRK
jgi:chaperonin GroEL